eukprot:TRINITY_DN1846_c0_g1_i6.p1 TRINITY_DN1846_c0_g1~~TRINITY_DN1846_c0_g1_i6.p1  ORF type:complete len:164 (+),score=48.12 TRINITY_DN1846_c0_g1_i6:112-603(+)
MKGYFILAFLVLVFANDLRDFLPSDNSEYNLRTPQSAFGDRITDCKVYKANFKPLQKEGEDWVLKYGCSGWCIIHINPCRPTYDDCNGVHGVFTWKLEGRDYCAVYTDTWENSIAEETTYGGRYAIKISSTKENYHLTMVKDCLLYTSPSPRDLSTSRMPSSA